MGAFFACYLASASSFPVLSIDPYSPTGRLLPGRPCPVLPRSHGDIGLFYSPKTCQSRVRGAALAINPLTDWRQ